MPPDLKRRDLDVMPTDPRYAAAGAALQIHGGHDPDTARTLARFVVDAVLRAGVRPTDGLPTNAEVDRARAALNRRAIVLERDDVAACLVAALVEEPVWT